jgi:hypothetical protein
MTPFPTPGTLANSETVRSSGSISNGVVRVNDGVLSVGIGIIATLLRRLDMRGGDQPKFCREASMAGRGDFAEIFL